ncbi:MAG TPA: hypothetical protein VF665_15335 [Longimicrobium sp.]|jgi:hypothetical protein|uniref:hypothetical protein n=1 Tax=Longimicrobium sp. TaxID=2029185 RepID=UPI002ED78D19
MKNIVRCALAALAVAAVPAAAQSPAGPDSLRRAGEVRAQARRPLERLLERRAEIGLSDAQVARLREIGRGLEARNAPLRERLAAERQRWMTERRARLQAMPQEQRREEMRRMRREREVPAPMQPLVRQMRENIAGAMREANGVLTEPQRQQVRRLLREEARSRGMRARRGARGQRPMRGPRPGRTAPGTQAPAARP